MAGKLEREEVASEYSLAKSGIEETDDSYPDEVTEEAEKLSDWCLRER